MIVLDTNVVSEVMKPEPYPALLGWLNNQAAEKHLSSVTLAELLYGIGALPVSKRNDLLEHAMNGLMALLRERMLPLDTDAARRYAELAATARNTGRGFITLDGYIAAIAASRGFIVASGDTAHYEAVGATVINPWNV